MRSIFLGSTKHIPTVYDKDLIAYLRGDAQICETIFSKSDVLEKPAQFAETEFIFFFRAKGLSSGEKISPEVRFTISRAVLFPFRQWLLR